MSKYKCLCGMNFKKEDRAKEHEDIFKSSPGFHFILTRNRRQRFWDWFWNYNWSRIFRFIGGYMIYIVLMKHFKITFDVMESLLIGIGMGLYIE